MKARGEKVMAKLSSSSDHNFSLILAAPPQQQF